MKIYLKKEKEKPNASRIYFGNLWKFAKGQSVFQIVYFTVEVVDKTNNK
jgi:hypothetical protein